MITGPTRVRFFMCDTIVLMIVAVLIILGLCLGSFANALVWRVHEQSLAKAKDDKQKKIKNKQRSAGVKRKTDLSTSVEMTEGTVEMTRVDGVLKQVQDDGRGVQDDGVVVQDDGRGLRDDGGDRLSILRGRSMCTDCGQELKARDLVPVLSWLSTGGKCRYCHKKVSAQYPIVEIATALLFVASYVFWPYELTAGSWQVVAFGLWLVILTGLMALLVYDLRWYLLPNRIVYPLTALAGLFAVIQVAVAVDPAGAVIDTALAVIVGGGIFYVLFQVSAGKWIGGGDVKLGWLLGLIIGSWAGSLLMIFIAALLGSLVSIPLMVDKKLKRNSIIPFGPFLIVGAIIVVLFGTQILDWYQQILNVS